MARLAASFARASDYIASLPHETVVVETVTIWTGLNLVRNDPWMRGPDVVMAEMLSEGSMPRVCAAHGPVALITIEDLRHLGVLDADPVDDRRDFRAELRARDCLIER